MYLEMLDILMCPECSKGSLQLQSAVYRDDEIWSGELVCSKCQQEYPVKNGIPCLVSKDLLDMQESADAQQWMKKKKEIEQAIIDEDMRTFQQVYKDAAKQDGLSEKMDRFLWERIMHLENHALRQHLKNDNVSKWVITKENLRLRNQRIFEKINKYAKSFPGSRILNIGPGIDDDLIDRLKSYGATVVNCDLILDTLVEIKSEKNSECVSADLNGLPFEEGSFDMVFCFLVLHHLQSIKTALAEMKRVLKPGGLTFILELNPYTPIKLPGRLLPSGVKKLIRKTMRSKMAGADQRLFKSTPYEKMQPSGFIVSSMHEVGLCDISRKVASYYPPFIPRPFASLWDIAARLLPFLFDPMAIEFIFHG
jgi:ubiquinone/menaquinone biosynthesis C-methylase UbiE/uncharacterized protein YbaR (Trm112 family)